MWPWLHMAQLLGGGAYSLRSTQVVRPGKRGSLVRNVEIAMQHGSARGYRVMQNNCIRGGLEDDNNVFM